MPRPFHFRDNNKPGIASACGLVLEVVVSNNRRLRRAPHGSDKELLDLEPENIIRWQADCVAIPFRFEVFVNVWIGKRRWEISDSGKNRSNDSDEPLSSRYIVTILLAMANTPKDFDLLLYGATGTTGRSAAKFLKNNAPKDFRLAIAGRNRRKLEELELNLPVIVADTTDRAQMQAMVARARVLLNMAGPFHGEEILIEACLETSTHYADISGETARIRRLINQYHDKAIQKQVKIINFGGVSSIPADVGAYLLDQSLGGRLVEAEAFLQIEGGSLNGGTVASMAQEIESGDACLAKDPFLLGPSGRLPSKMEQTPKGISWDSRLLMWTHRSPMETSDTKAVRRSFTLTGRSVIFQERQAHTRLRNALSMWLSLNLLGFAMSWKPTRALVKKMVPPGTGTNKERRRQGFLHILVRGRSSEGTQAQVSLQFSGDLSNTITVMTACQVALCLAADEEKLPKRFGVLTPTVGLGSSLIDRLISSGVKIK